MSPMRLSVLLVLVCLAKLCSVASVPDISWNSPAEYFPDPVPPDEVSRLGNAFGDPKLLWRLKGKPLHETFWTLLDYYHLEQAAYSEVAPIAAEILFSHPDLEVYLRDRIERLAAARSRQWVDRDFYQQSQDTPITDKLKRYTAIAARVPGDAAFRLVGPQLYGDAVDINMGDVVDWSPAEVARGYLARLVSERLPGETLPRDLAGAKIWWAENAERFSSPNDEGAKLGKREASGVLLPGEEVTGAESSEGRTSGFEEVNGASGWSKTWLWLGGAFIIAFASLRRLKKRSFPSQVNDKKYE